MVFRSLSPAQYLRKTGKKAEGEQDIYRADTSRNQMRDELDQGAGLSKSVQPQTKDDGMPRYRGLADWAAQERKRRGLPTPGQDSGTGSFVETRRSAPIPRGVVRDPGQPEADDNPFKMIDRAARLLRNAFGRQPVPGEMIPAELVDPYLTALSADRFDRREDIEFFDHLTQQYRQAFPVTKKDISGRMIDTPAVSIPFAPFGSMRGSVTISGRPRPQMKRDSKRRFSGTGWRPVIQRRHLTNIDPCC